MEPGGGSIHMQKNNLDSQAEKLKDGRIPDHVAIIMDGNGRWAGKRFLPRIEGHRAGAKSVKNALESAISLNISYLTLFTFSIENWERPKSEVSDLMRMLKQHLLKEKQSMISNGIRIKACGSLGLLPEDVRKTLSEMEEATAGCDKLQLVLALSYGSRQEIAQAAIHLAGAVRRGELDVEEINDKTFSKYLFTSGIPPVDLLVRTSGEFRMSNFFLWQAEGAYLHFTETLWPDFNRRQFYRAVAEYQKALCDENLRKRSC